MNMRAIARHRFQRDFLGSKATFFYCATFNVARQTDGIGCKNKGFLEVAGGPPIGPLLRLTSPGMLSRC